MRDQDSDEIKRLLKRLGFTVHGIPAVTVEKRPNLVAISGDSKMFVEVKARVQDSKLRADMEAVPADETKPILTPLEKHSTLSAEIKDANEQLGTVAAADDHRLLWFRAGNDLFVHGVRDQIISTLLGIRVVDATRDGNRRPVRCAYAGFADFYRFREIDGTIVETGDSLTLILNQFSERHAAFKGSYICKVLPSAVIVDVAQAVQDGDCYVVDGAVNRHDDEAVLAFLRAKYPQDSFHEFVSHSADTTVTVIDARSVRLPNKPLQPDQPPIVNG